MEPESAAPARPARLSPLLVVLGAGSLAFDASLVHAHPELYWADGYSRALAHDQILIDRWLPLLQLVVHAVGEVTASLVALRLVLAALAALAVVAAAALGTSLARATAGACFAVLLATNLLFVGLSIVPYQEVLFAGLVFAGLVLHPAAATGGRVWPAALAFNLACLTRYEGWVLVLCLAVSELAGETARRGLARGVRHAALLAFRYGFSAAAWLAGLASLGDAGRLWTTPSSVREPLLARFTEYVRQCDWQLGGRVIVASALLGLVVSLARADRRRHLVIVAFVVASVGYVLSGGPYSPGNLRRTFLPVVFALLYAAIGLDFLVERAVALSGIGRAAAVRSAILAVVVCLLAASSARRAAAFVAASSDEFHAPYLVGTWLHGLSDDERKRAHVALLGSKDTDWIVVALHAGLPGTSVVDAGETLAAGTTHVVRIARPGQRLSAAAASLVTQLEDGTVPAREDRAGAAVIWTLAAAARTPAAE